MGKQSTKKPVVSQQEYDNVIRTIEENSIYRFSAGDDHSGAFLVPTSGNGNVVGEVFHCDWKKLQKLAELMKNKPT